MESVHTPHTFSQASFSESASPRRLMLFDLSIYGHHPGYIQHLIQHWHRESYTGELTILVSPLFLVEHSNVVMLAQKLDRSSIRFVAITEAENSRLRPRSNGLNRNLRNVQEWQLLCRYAKNLSVDHILLMYYDTYEYCLALNVIKPPCSVSGIYFRPTFHYGAFAQCTISRKEKLQQKWKRLILSQVLRNPKVDTLFSLDPFVVDHIHHPREKTKVVHLADPISPYSYSVESVDALKQSLCIETGRKICLLFGALTERKGIYQLLEAIPLLKPEICHQLAFVFVGESHPSHQKRIDQAVKELQRICPVQIILHYQFVADEDVQKYFQISDLVLAPYQKHVGMSGILILAAAAQKPVLSSNYGLMGEIIRQYQLGLAVDTTVPKQIAQGLVKFVNDSDELIGDRIQLRIFAEQNSADIFSRKILLRLQESVSEVY